MIHCPGHILLPPPPPGGGEGVEKERGRRGRWHTGPTTAQIYGPPARPKAITLQNCRRLVVSVVDFLGVASPTVAAIAAATAAATAIATTTAAATAIATAAAAAIVAAFEASGRAHGESY